MSAHRADRTARRSVPRTGGLPTLLGAAALCVSVLGTLSAAGPGASAVASAERPVLAAANALSGTSQAARSSLSRERDAAVSRDSSREALGRAAEKELLAAAEAQMRQRNVALARFAKQAEAQAARIKRNTWTLPVASYRLTATFGQYGLWSSYHTGLDFAAPSGTPIMSVANGLVTAAGYDGAYGNKTVVTLEDGTEVWYCHQSSFTVSVGDTVRSGEVIGYIGSTGNVTGPHLHLEVRPGGGDPLDPYGALVQHGLTP